MPVLFISLFVLAPVVLFYFVIVLYIQFVLELNSINKKWLSLTLKTHVSSSVADRLIEM